MKRFFWPYHGEICSVSNVQQRLHSIILPLFLFFLFFFYLRLHNLNSGNDVYNVNVNSLRSYHEAFQVYF